VRPWRTAQKAMPSRHAPRARSASLNGPHWLAGDGHTREFCTTTFTPYAGERLVAAFKTSVLNETDMLLGKADRSGAPLI
jgi:hypothetical protein